ncbi:MAG: hypothetical protein JRE58_10465 [Deltaproteobacteria bacterium]|nr:hypothetical protein [Deltaproteobacteria bacterium]
MQFSVCQYNHFLFHRPGVILLFGFDSNKNILTDKPFNGRPAIHGYASKVRKGTM